MEAECTMNMDTNNIIENDLLGDNKWKKQETEGHNILDEDKCMGSHINGDYQMEGDPSMDVIDGNLDPPKMDIMLDEESVKEMGRR